MTLVVALEAVAVRAITLMDGGMILRISPSRENDQRKVSPLHMKKQKSGIAS